MNHFLRTAADNRTHCCELAFALVLKDGRLNKNIAEEILSSFEKVTVTKEDELV
ncbi:MAG: hypothetical protein ACJAXY_001513 [Nonlabens sp.]